MGQRVGFDDDDAGVEVFEQHPHGFGVANSAGSEEIQSGFYKDGFAAENGIA